MAIREDCLFRLRHCVWALFRPAFARRFLKLDSPSGKIFLRRFPDNRSDTFWHSPFPQPDIFKQNNRSCGEHTSLAGSHSLSNTVRAGKRDTPQFFALCFSPSLALILVILLTFLTVSRQAHAVNELKLPGACQYHSSSNAQGDPQTTHVGAAKACLALCNDWEGSNGETRDCLLVGGSLNNPPQEFGTYYEYNFSHTVRIEYSSGQTSEGNWITTKEQLCKEPGCPTANCRADEIWDAVAGACQKTNEHPPACPAAGNPVNAMSGNKHQVEIDIPDVNKALSLTRFYSSDSVYGLASYLGPHWRSNYEQFIELIGIHPTAVAGEYLHDVAVVLANGQRLTFSETLNGDWVSNKHEGHRLTGAPGVGWVLQDEKNRTRTYNSYGLLTEIVNQDGYTQTLVYGSPNSAVEKYNLLERVTDSTGHQLVLTYEANGVDDRVSTVTDHTNRTWSYRYDAAGNLEFVDNPDGTIRQYHYNEQALTSNTDLPHALTGITDERALAGERYATYEYYPDGRAKASYHAGNAQKVTFSYNDTTGKRTVTNSLNQASTYSTTVQLGVMLVTDITGPGCSTCGSSDTISVYDANNHLIGLRDTSSTTRFGDYDSQGQFGCKVEGLSLSDTTPNAGDCAFDPVTSPDARRTDYTYDARFINKRTTLTGTSVHAGSSTVTSYTYDTFGNRTSETISGFDPTGSPVTRTTTWQYGGDGSLECDAVPLHQPCRSDGPRTDIDDYTILPLSRQQHQCAHRLPRTFKRNRRCQWCIDPQQYPVLRHRQGVDPNRAPTA